MIRIFVLSLTLGVVITVLVAWSGEFVIGTPFPASPAAGVLTFPAAGERDPLEALWRSVPMHPGLQWDYGDNWWQESTWCLTRTTESASAVDADQRHVSVVINRVETGWPMRCLERRHWISDPLSKRPDGVSHGMLSLPWRRFQIGGTLITTPRRVAFLPMFPGIIVNLLLFSACTSLLLSVPRAVRHLRRRRRMRNGRCAMCGYDLRGAGPAATLDAQHAVEPPRCPECGVPVGS